MALLKQFQESDFGYLYTDNQVCVFFGKAAADQAYLEKEFSDFKFHKIQQTHSDKLVASSSQILQADAHWTASKKVGLLIATADCIPILILNESTKTIAAVHAGWKGICNQITYKTLLALSTKDSTAQDFCIWVGPHISKSSFEVKQDVLDRLLKSSFEKDRKIHHEINDQKILVDLKSILLSQVKNAIGSDFKSFELIKDTMTTSCLNSYRRDSKSSGRNLSFIGFY